MRVFYGVEEVSILEAFHETRRNVTTLFIMYGLYTLDSKNYAVLKYIHKRFYKITRQTFW